jgi:BASS family bile acid:Na+ symporter
MALTDLLIRGSSVAVVVFVVSSTLGVGLSLTVGQILAPLKNARLVVLSLAANFVLAPLVALGLWRCSVSTSRWGSACCCAGWRRARRF